MEVRGWEEEFLQDSSDQLKIPRPWGKLSTLKGNTKIKLLILGEKVCGKRFFVMKKVL